jgi:pimeloyl-ACP methyl ester carboxylesterase
MPLPAGARRCQVDGDLDGDRQGGPVDTAHLVAGRPTARSVRLPDGRDLAWSEWGPPDGRPVLFCPGAGMSGVLGFGVDVLPELGLRLLALDRPGLGRSTHDPVKTHATWAADVGHVVRAEGLRHALGVGFSQGAPFAVALAGAGLVDAVALVAGQDDLRAQRHLLVPEVAGMLDAVDADPDGFEREIAQVADADWMWRVIVTTAAARDRALYEGTPLGAAVRAALDDGFRQGAAGYARDLRTALGPWPVRPEDVRTPVHLWYGAHDTSTVHSPDRGRALARRFPGARHTVLDGEGGALLWTRARNVLTALAPV